ncbi:MAG: hypothetical protein K5912_01360 [Alphaproteobacteria bacterium]|nr:hypothetical protein [Alphaproteobacteria bacterium]
MTNKLQSALDNFNRQKYATDSGTLMHTKLQSVFFLPTGATGDQDIIKSLSKIPELCEYMGDKSKTEVPIAGIINGLFISRRIDRLYVNRNTKTVVVIDYKTDTNHTMFFKKYTEQLTEYKALLKQIYPDFLIQCKILWTSDFTLENII